jgi:hypothetical protein
VKIKRKVVKFENYINPHANGTGGTNVLFLECGHTTSRKFSQGVPENVFCRDCEQWANGTTISRREGNIVETWDAAKQMPVFTEVAQNKKPLSQPKE